MISREISASKVVPTWEAVFNTARTSMVHSSWGSRVSHHPAWIFHQGSSMLEKPFQMESMVLAVQALNSRKWTQQTISSTCQQPAQSWDITHSHSGSNLRWETLQRTSSAAPKSQHQGKTMTWKLTSKAVITKMTPVFPRPMIRSGFQRKRKSQIRSKEAQCPKCQGKTPAQTSSRSRKSPMLTNTMTSMIW